MKALSKILFPAAVMAFTAAVALDFGGSPVGSRRAPVFSAPQDTIIYASAGYKARRSAVNDTSIHAESDSLDFRTELIDTTNAPTRISPRDSLKAILDSTMWDKIDSIYLADSTAKAKAAFEAWYAGLDKYERKKYDTDQKMKRKLAKTDSLKAAREEKQNIKDSILAEKPRILETYAVPDSLHFKRIIAWNPDPDFGNVEPFVPDTTYNYHFYDYPFLRKDVNATWLGVAGSPAQYYNFFNRDSEEDVEFYKAQELWTVSHRTARQYNTKTPYTELAYYGTILGSRDKESNNLHLFTSQNITPEFNFSLLYDRFGGAGMLESEETINKTTAVQANYLGKKYTMNAGYLYNMVSRQENGGMVDNTWVRDTTVDSRDIRVVLNGAKSRIKKNTFYVDQQLRIPFTFLEKMKAKRDSTYSFNADSLVRDITTAYVGHSSELSFFTREYSDAISDAYGRAYYNNVFNYGPVSADSLHVTKLDNKVYIRLQPWSADAAVSKLDIGAGDYMRSYFDSTSVRPTRHVENSFYVYAGAQGQMFGHFFWDAGAKYVMLGHEFGDFDINGNAEFRFYPFRRARKSPLTLGAHFESTLKEPNYYQQHINANHYRWDNEFSKISTTKIRGSLDIPRWKIHADVGYALLANNIYYGTDGIIRQNDTPMSVLSADLRKDLKLGPFHLDNRALLQFSSNEEVLPLPLASFNLRYYLEFVVQRNEAKTQNVMTMQLGANAWFNTKWYSPAWNPNLGVFHNQTDYLYTNGPYFDIFANAQWKRACVFIKYQNAGGGWPLKKYDYFSAHHYVLTSGGTDGLKLGVTWPFYTQPSGISRSSSAASSSSSSSSSNRTMTPNSSVGGRRKASKK